MPYESLTCPSCGATIEDYDPVSKSYVCQYCDSLIVLSVVDSTSSSGDNRYSENSNELFERIQGLIALGDYAKAIDLLAIFEEQYPGQFRGWRLNYEVTNRNRFLPESVKCVEKMCKVANHPDDFAYLRKLKKDLEERSISLKKKQDEFEAKKDEAGQYLSAQKSRVDSEDALLQRAEEAAQAAADSLKENQSLIRAFRTGMILFTILGLFIGGLSYPFDIRPALLAFVMFLIFVIIFTIEKSGLKKKLASLQEEAKMLEESQKDFRNSYGAKQSEYDKFLSKSQNCDFELSTIQRAISLIERACKG